MNSASCLALSQVLGRHSRHPSLLLNSLNTELMTRLMDTATREPEAAVDRERQQQGAAAQQQGAAHQQGAAQQRTRAAGTTGAALASSSAAVRSTPQAAEKTYGIPSVGASTGLHSSMDEWRLLQSQGECGMRSSTHAKAALTGSSHSLERAELALSCIKECLLLLKCKGQMQQESGQPYQTQQPDKQQAAHHQNQQEDQPLALSLYASQQSYVSTHLAPVAHLLGCHNPLCTTTTCPSESQLQLYRCGGCDVAWYCSRECQRQAWGLGHGQVCTAGAAWRQGGDRQ